MTTARGRRRLAAVLLLTGLAAAPALAAGEAPLRAAVVVHLLGAPSPLLPAGARELREAALDQAAALLNARGVATVERAGVEDLVRRHVVRSGGSYGPGFLDDLAGDAGASLLLAIAIQAEGARLTASARAIDTNGGALVGIGYSEAVAGDDGWRQALREALRGAMPALTPPAGRAPLVVLPTRVVGTSTHVARAATAGVLASALADGRWLPLDPALVSGAVAAAGCDLERLDRRGREVLREACGADWAIVPEIVSFGGSAASGAMPEAEDGPAEARASLDGFTLNLRLLDLRTGVVTGTAASHIAGGPSQGWFGRIDDKGEWQRIRAAAGQAWARFHGFLQEKAS